MNDVKFLGNFYRKDGGQGFAGATFDINGLAPTITTMQGGNRQPCIVVKEKEKDYLGVTLFESKEFGGFKLCQDGKLCPTLRAQKVCAAVIEINES